MERLKLMALDAEDLAVVSSAVQDALVPVRDCAWFREERRFALLLNRFRWEVEEEPYSRTHSALVFNDVTSVHHHKVPLGEPDRVLELLAVAQEGPNTVVLRFAADRAIRLEIARVACHLEDVGEPWATPWQPAHPDQ
jgi:hypothetical protein